MRMQTEKVLLLELLKNTYEEEFIRLIIDDKNILKTTLKKLNIKYEINSSILDMYMLIKENIELYIENSNFIILDIERDILNLLKEYKKQSSVLILDCNSILTINFIKSKIEKTIQVKNIGKNLKEGLDKSIIYFILNEEDDFLYNTISREYKIIKMFDNVIELEREEITSLKEELDYNE